MIHLRGIFKKQINHSLGGNIAVFLVVAMIGAFLVFPLIYVANAAFKPIDEIQTFPPSLLVKKFTWDNFIQLGQMTSTFWAPITRYAFNSIFVSIVTTGCHVFFGSMAAYPLAKHQFVGKKVMNSVVRMALLFTPGITAIPLYIVMSTLGLINTYAAMILPSIASTLGLYLMQNFMVNFPDSVLEAARIDGANEFRVFARVVMPNMRPAVMTMMIFSFISIWNSSGGVAATGFIYEERMKTLTSAMGMITSAGMARSGVAAAVLLLLMLPPILLFLFAQKMVIETMTTSGMK